MLHAPKNMAIGVMNAGGAHAFEDLATLMQRRRLGSADSRCISLGVAPDADYSSTSSRVTYRSIGTV
jgi:hypothetical protein